MKKYIAGFRSNNPKNKKKAIIVYAFITLAFAIGSERTVNDIALWLITMATPTMFYSFRDFRLKGYGYEERRNRFFQVLGVYIVLFLLFGLTTPTSKSQVEVPNTSYSQGQTEGSNKTNESNSDKVDKDEVKDSNTTVVNAREAELHFINTGNSDAILIMQDGQAALIDGGDNDDESRVVSYLKSQGITELEYVFATHPHADHIGGLDAVVDSIKVKRMFVSNGSADTKTYRDFINSMARKGLSPSVPLLNSEFELGASKFKVVSVANTEDPNNNSIVLLYTNGNDKVLLTGDAEAEVESKINVGDIDLLKVGHHGSSSSSTKTFINKIDPEEAVILVGKDNKYGHPHKETMETLQSKKINVHRSDECGDIIYISSGNGLNTKCKKGSYTQGSKKGNTSLPAPKPVPAPQEITGGASSGETVYWTPNGKSYHSTNTCSTLSRSKVINSGTLSQSGKSDPCDKCN
ncbi:MAG: MBL fold metallo-hydrolase [Clostridium sp.]